MDGYSGKRGAGGTIAPRKGYNVGLKNASTDRDQNGQFCNRIGCSGRIKYQNTKIGSSDKAKFSKPSFSSSNRNEMIGNSSRSSYVQKSSYLDSERKSNLIRQKVANQESTKHHLTSKNKLEEVTNAKYGNSSVPSKIGSRKMFHHNSGSNNNQNTQPSSSVSSVSKRSGVGTVNSSNNIKSRYGLKNLKCNSISDCSSSESKSAGKSVMKTGQEGESSLSRRWRQNGQFSASTSGISISDSGRSSFASGDSKDAGSVRTRRSMNVNNSRTRLSYRQNGRNGSSLREPPFNVGGRVSRSNILQMDLQVVRVRVRVLLALERIEQDEELTHEELLALEDRMGTVSTALSEEALSKCIKRSIYYSTPSEVRITGSSEDGDDIKCSVCQVIIYFHKQCFL
ncbi:hypothetical protein DH2020_049331 [Rehmannia glutinosa]|uniref:RING-type E3 ubiquitin transferase n=1 Tax=Rehmannia glutinosa TaxID=99300 RepID=A0ABR0U3T9_REHGL